MISHETTTPVGSSQDRPRDAQDGQTIADLLKSLRNNLTILFRQEIALARGEMVENFRRTSRHIIAMAVGGAVAFAGAIVLLLGLASASAAALAAAGLDPGIAVWLGPLLLGVIVAAIGLVIIQTAKQKLKRTSLVPKRTVQTIKEDSNWAKDKLHRS